MANETLSPSEIANSPEQIAQRQLISGNEWAELYANDSSEDAPMKSAEIVLRNPCVYLNDISNDFSFNKLSEDLRTRWNSLLVFSDAVVRVAGTEDKEWNESTSGIEKLQGLMYSGSVNPKFRGSIADVMRLSSELFAESSVIIPGNTHYYEGNVRGMESWITRHRQPIE